MILFHLLFALEVVLAVPPLGTFPSPNEELASKTNYSWPDKVMAPFLSLKKFPLFDINTCIAKTSVKTFILSSINGDSDGTPSWHGTDNLNDTFYSESIKEIRKAGGDVAISFGGGKGHEFATDNFVVLASKYQRVIDVYNLNFIDIDIQSNMSEPLASIDNRVKAFNLVRSNNPNLQISLSFLATPSGLDPHSRAVLQSCKNTGFTPDVVNLITMDFENIQNGDTKMGDYSIAALENGQAFLKTLSLRSKMGMTFMIGVNDLHNEIFQLSDAEKVLKWAETIDYLYLISFWSINRDNDDIGGPLFSSSQIEQTNFQFANTLKSWTKDSDVLGTKKEHKAIAIPSKILAPQVDILSWPTFDIVQATTTTGNLWYNLLYINSDGLGNTTWGGNVMLDENFYLSFIQTLRDNGGDVIVTFGGPDGESLASDLRVPDVAALAAKYQEVINLYDLSVIDFHLTPADLTNVISIKKRNSALVLLRKANPTLKIIFSLPVDINGLTSDSVAILKATLSDGLDLNIVNIIAMNYESAGGKLYDSIIASAKNAYNQIQDLGLSKTTIGVSPMIGVNNVANEIFGLEDARNFVNWAKDQSYLSYLSFLSANRDSLVSGTISQEPSLIQQSEFEFTKIFNEWLSSSGNAESSTVVEALPATSTLVSIPTPDFSSFPRPFLPDLTYSAGYRWASKVLAPFVNTIESFDILKLSNSVGSARYILSFINLSKDGKTPIWGSKVPVKDLTWLDAIQSIRLFGGDVIFSFNGPSGNDIANGFISLKSLTIAYQNIIDAYNIGWIDFYVDENSMFNQTTADFRNEALRNLQSSNPNLIISYSVPSGLDGLKESSIQNLISARQQGVRIDVVNLLTFNFSSDLQDAVSSYIIQSVAKSIDQLPTVGYPEAKVGVVALIGENPSNAAENFNTSDAAILTKWAKQNSKVQLLSYLDANSDSSLGFAKQFVQFEN